MNDTITAKEFSALCRANGFSRKGKVFSRCIGDGIFQNISLEQSDYISMESPERTEKHRKSTYIMFDFWSMYHNIPDYFFTETKYLGEWAPEVLLRQCPNRTPFMGTQHHYRIMIEKGFDFLNSIRTQRDLLDAMLQMEIVEYGRPLYHNVKLCEPFLICGENKEAIYRLNGMIMQNCSAFHSKFDHLRREGNTEEYFRYLDEHQEKINKLMKLSWACILDKKDVILERLQTNFQRNYQLAKENKIAFSEDFHAVDLEKIFL